MGMNARTCRGQAQALREHSMGRGGQAGWRGQGGHRCLTAGAGMVCWAPQSQGSWGEQRPSRWGWLSQQPGWVQVALGGAHGMNEGEGRSGLAPAHLAGTFTTRDSGGGLAASEMPPGS